MVDRHQSFAGIRTLLKQGSRFLLFGGISEQAVQDWTLLLAQLLLHAQQSIVVDVFWVAAVLILETRIFVDLVVNEVVRDRSLLLLIEAAPK